MKNFFDDWLGKIVLSIWDAFFKPVPQEIDHIPLEPVLVIPPKPVPIPIAPEVQLTPREKLYLVSKGCLTPKHDVSPLDRAPDDVACAESFSEVYRAAIGIYPNYGNMPTLSTIDLYQIFTSHPDRFRAIQNPGRGVIAICVTRVVNGVVDHGHVAVCGDYGLMSNDSYDHGDWKENYTYDRWHEEFEVRRGFITHYFEPI